MNRSDTMSNPLFELMERYRKGKRSTFNFFPFVPIVILQEKDLEFNDILKEPGPMLEASLINYELGFEAVALPFDLNVEAELLGAEVRYHEGYDGIPVYPTIGDKVVWKADDIVIPDNIQEGGRVPIILECIKDLKEKISSECAVCAFIPGPFTLAGQIMDLDELFVMTMKKPDEVEAIFSRIADLIIRLRDIYVDGGVDCIDIEDGGATSISPKLFESLLLPSLKRLFQVRPVPQVLSLTGSADRYLELVLECRPDGIGVDQESDIDRCREIVPHELPLFAICGDYIMLANATPKEVVDTVKKTLDKGVTSVLPPSDIYPPAKMENIEAFIRTLRDYET
jgi:[methyl-Co(III) methanol-specific corrinoid protein]:coenzyme M methyltransferase